jgi:hypothetical protein
VIIRADVLTHTTVSAGQCRRGAFSVLKVCIPCPSATPLCNRTISTGISP